MKRIKEFFAVSLLYAKHSKLGIFARKALNEWERAKEFYAIYSLYAKHQPRLLSARIAYGIAFKGLPF